MIERLKGGRAEAFLRCTSGATAIEYALIAGGVAVAISTAVTSLGGSVQGLFQGVSDGMDGEDTSG